MAVAGAWLVTPEYLQYVAAVAAERLAVKHSRMAALLAEVWLHKGRVAIRDWYLAVRHHDCIDRDP